MKDSLFYVVLSFKGYLFKKLFSGMMWVLVPTFMLASFHHYVENYGSEAFQSEWAWMFTESLSLPGLLGAALGVLLVFRNNTAYDRWWEARKVLGSLVNTSRSFALQANQYIKDEKVRTHLIGLIGTFPFALKCHLRADFQSFDVNHLGKEAVERINKWKHIPNGVAHYMMEVIQQQRESGEINDFKMIKLAEYVDQLIDILGKCERIRNTPMPAAHTYLLRVFIFVYVLIMPFGFIVALKFWTVLAVAAIYYVAMSIVVISEEIEEPFGTDSDDLPVDGIAKNIFRNVMEIKDKELDNDSLLAAKFEHLPPAS